MLWDASAINGYSIEASDGRIGTVSDMLFDDAGWAIRWLVVDTGNWLAGRTVLLPLSALVRPDRALRRFLVELTMQQVKDSPDVKTDQPVSRQTEAHIYNYYSWDPYWDNNFFPISEVMVTSFTELLHPPGYAPHYPDSADAQPNDDPHLRSIAVVTGHHVHATDGEIGHVEDFLVDDSDWNVRYLIVNTRNWWPGEKVLISPRSVREIGWTDKLVHLDVNCQKVRGSPSYDPSVTVDGAYDEKFLTYYGINWILK